MTPVLHFGVVKDHKILKCLREGTVFRALNIVTVHHFRVDLTQFASCGAFIVLNLDPASGEYYFRAEMNEGQYEGPWL